MKTPVASIRASIFMAPVLVNLKLESQVSMPVAKAYFDVTLNCPSFRKSALQDPESKPQAEPLMAVDVTRKTPVRSLWKSAPLNNPLSWAKPTTRFRADATVTVPALRKDAAGDETSCNT
jgi:hypothetical protein